MVFTFIACDDNPAVPEETHQHEFVDGICSCGAFDPTYTQVATLEALKTELQKDDAKIILTDVIATTATLLLNAGSKTVINGNGKTLAVTYAGLVPSNQDKGNNSIFNAVDGNNLEGLQAGTELRLVNITLENNAEADRFKSQGYAVVIGTDSNGTKVTIENSTIKNFYTGVYCQQQSIDAEGYTLTIKNCKYENTTYGCSTYEASTSKNMVATLDNLTGLKEGNEDEFSTTFSLKYAPVVEVSATTFEVVVEGSNGSSETKTIEITAKAGEYQEFVEGGVKGSVYVTEKIIKTAEDLKQFVAENSAFDFGYIEGTIATGAFAYQNAGSTLKGGKDSVLEVEGTLFDGQSIIALSANDVTFDGFTVSFKGNSLEKTYHILKVTSVSSWSSVIKNITLQDLTLNLENTEEGTTYSCRGLNIHGVRDVVCKNITVKGKSSSIPMQVASANNLVIDNPVLDRGALSWGGQYLGFMWGDADYYTPSIVTLKNTDNLPSFYVEGPDYFVIKGAESYTQKRFGTKDVYTK